jgi:Signal transduction histidine kinase
MILNISRIEANKHEILKSKINVFQTIKGIVNLFELLAAEKNVVLKFEAESDSLFIETDVQMLNSIINNMIDNALKYTIEGSVTVYAGRQGMDNKKFLLIKVQDTGIGISKENMEIIFEEFRQVSEGYNRSFEGTGLGLTIIKRYIDLLKGKIRVESKLGEGSTFYVYLPIEEPDADKLTILEENLSEDKNVVTTETKLQKILLVDDDVITSNIVKRWMNKIAEVDYAEDSQEAFELYSKKIYPIVILDINLKLGGNGIEVLKKLRKTPGYENIPVIACTAYAMEGDKENLISEGFDYYISKPFEKRELISLISGILKTVK